MRPTSATPANVGTIAIGGTTFLCGCYWFSARSFYAYVGSRQALSSTAGLNKWYRRLSAGWNKRETINQSPKMICVGNKVMHCGIGLLYHRGILLGHGVHIAYRTVNLA